MVQRKSFDLYLARTAGMLSGARRVAMLLMTLLLTMTAQTAWATITGSGTAGDPYIISSTDDWNTFANESNAGTYWASGVCVKMGADIGTAENPVTAMVGTSDNLYAGTFDGSGYTLTVQYGSAESYLISSSWWAAPFSRVNGAVIKNLQVAGNIYANYRASGLVGNNNGNTRILNCHSSVSLYTDNTYNCKHTGFIAQNYNGSAIIANCRFDGQFLGATAQGCYGFAYNYGTSSFIEISNCLFAPLAITTKKNNQSDTFRRDDSGAASSINNCYYTETLGQVQGTDATGMTDAELAAALGPMWEVRNEGGVDKVLPIYNTNHLSGATVSGLSRFYRYTGAEIADLGYTLKNLEGNDLTEGTHYSISMTCNGSPVTKVQDVGDYTLTFTGLSPYSGTKEASFTVIAYPEVLSIDTDYSPNDNEFFYLNAPIDNTANVNLAGFSDGFTFKVYDDGGKNGKYTCGVTETVVIEAPTDYVLQATGYFSGQLSDYLRIYDGSDTSSPALFVGRSTGNIGTLLSTGQSLTIQYQIGNTLSSEGMNLTLKLVSTNTTHDVNISNPLTGGVINSNPLTAKVHDNVTLTATPANGYLLSDVTVTGIYNNNVSVADGKWYSNNTAMFKMPGTDVTVTPTFTTAHSATDGLEILVPSSGVINATIPASVTSFKVYDNGGKDNRYNAGDGDIVLTAPEGYKFRLSGAICTYLADASRNYLAVYDGTENTNAKLIDNLTSTVGNTVDQIDAVNSTGNTMRIRFYSDYNSNGDIENGGINLLIEMVNTSVDYDVTVNNNSEHGVIHSDKATSKATEVVTLTASTDDGYMVENISVTDGNSQPVSVEGGKWYNYYTQNKATFVMPNSAATVSSTYTNATTAENGLYIDLPKIGLINVTLPDGIQSFKVYDNGGASGDYESDCRSTLVLTAPEGYELRLTGTITTAFDYDHLSVYDGTDEDATKLLLNQVKSATEDTPFDIGTKVSTTGSMRLYFWTNSDDNNSAGLDLKVEIIPGIVKHSITLNNPDAGGSVASDKTEAAINEAVALTLTPADATYLPSGLAITSSNPAKLEWTGSFSNSATMTMPFADVTVAPTFTSTWTAAGGLLAMIPRNGSASVNIPAGVQSFKIYDHGGPTGNYDEHIEGQLTLTAPTGYKHQLTGTVATASSWDDLTVKDNATKTNIINQIRSTSDGTPLDIGTVTSSGESITLYFNSNWGHEYAGLDLTSTLVPIEYTITYTDAVNGTDGVTNTNPTTYTIESAAITLSDPTKDGYTFAGWYDNAGLTGDAITGVAIAAASTGNKTFYAKWTKNELALTESDGITEAITNAWKGKTVDITFTRTFEALSDGESKASTLCLPFDFAKPSTTTVGTFYTFGGVSEDVSGEYVVTMNEVTATTISAGTPYMFKPATTDPIVFQNTAYAVPPIGFAPAGTTFGNDWAFIGTYEEKTWDEGQTHLYGFAASNYKKSDNSYLNEVGAFRRFDYGHIYPFRCYLMAPGSLARGVSKAGSQLPESMKVILVSASGETTAVGTLDTRTGEVTFDGDGWYSLDGRKLSGKPTKKGLYINNGKTVVIK